MSTDKKEKWEGIHPDSVSPEQAKYILAEAQTFLASLNELSNRITKRSFTILAITLSFCSFLYSVLWNSVIKGVAVDLSIYWPVVITLIPLIYPLTVLVIVVFPRDSYPNGRRPKQINMDVFKETKDDKKEKYFILSEIKTYQNHIDKVEAQNISRTKKYKRAFAFLIGYSIFLLIFLLFY